ncbi:ABC transporter permease [Companilactobacillus crustorum]|uniref:ABC-type Na+ efflux pump, permease n=3 Tax=Companilactobacillus TaxID=2767879 RepID=A0A837RMA0_9LACO|nr:ABC transporter permease [Companilactobacillus crustorum]KRK44494.1 ABC-type Na+ efflux pump, permease [Companilactobacillus crustorum JCM 15951]KRO21855.1 ABC-type Na+ efflux pump, permease [Companilactobacillus crustorum]GEO76030.1 ABC transporter permease [Companilactobacillus crustorum]
MNKLWIVTFETFLRQIKSWGFVMLVIGPFLMFGITVGAGYLGGKSGGTSDEIAVISQQSQLRDGFAKANKDVVMNNVTDKKTATKKMDANKLAGYLVLKIDNNRVTGQYFGTKSLSSNLKVKVNSYLNQIQQQLNLTNAQLSKQQLQSLQQKSQLKETIQEKAGTNNLVKTISYWITVMMVYIILITYTTITAQEIASEKGTKIMEIIFSSTTAIKYFLEKIFGILLVILTQILIYLVGGWGIYIFAQNSSLTKGFLKQYNALITSVLHNILSINLLYLLLGVVIYTVLAAFSGALVAKAEDASKAAQPVIMLNLLAFFITFPFQNNLDSIIVKILSYVPFFSSYFMPMRIINNDASGMEIILSLLVLIVSIILLSMYIGKIYQGLMLQTDDSSFWKRFKRGISYNK